MVARDFNLIAEYLARRDVPALTRDVLGSPVDLIVLLGSSLLGPIRVAANAMHAGCASALLVCGGIGHSTLALRDAVQSRPEHNRIDTVDRSEAEIMRDILLGYYRLQADSILTENRSTNCGSNAVEAHGLLQSLKLHPRRIVLIQDPTMQRRTHASFVRAWADEEEMPEFISFAPFIPSVKEGPIGLTVHGDSDGVWTSKRFVSLILGEVLRLRDDESGYGPNGQNFIDHVDIPEDVLAAYDRVSLAYKLARVCPASSDVGRHGHGTIASVDYRGCLKTSWPPTL